MLPQQIKKIRKSLKLTQAEFAQLFGVHAMTISKWERGCLEPSPYQFALIREFKLAIKAGLPDLMLSFSERLVIHGPVNTLHFLLCLSFQS